MVFLEIPNVPKGTGYTEKIIYISYNTTITANVVVQFFTYRVLAEFHYVVRDKVESKSLITTFCIPDIPHSYLTTFISPKATILCYTRCWVKVPSSMFTLNNTTNVHVMLSMYLRY